MTKSAQFRVQNQANTVLAIPMHSQTSMMIHKPLAYNPVSTSYMSPASAAGNQLTAGGQIIQLDLFRPVQKAA